MSQIAHKMKGIAIIHDETNNKKYAQIDLDIHGELWEDFYDGMMAELAKNDEMIPLEDVIAEFKSKGIVDAEI